MKLIALRTSIVALLLFFACAPAFADGHDVRLNCGGQGFTDSQGQPWLPDNFFTSGDTYSSGQPIAGTEDDVLYQSERWGSQFSYNVPLPAGDFEVRLHFAEIFFSAPGKRVLDVWAEGQTVVDDLDIVVATGPMTAMTISTSLAVNDGMLDLSFQGELQNAKVSGIEILEVEHEGHPFLHVVIDGPSNLVDYDGDGVESVSLDGSASHTHELGHELTNFTWTEDSTVLGTGTTLDVTLGLGDHPITLTIEDDNVPPEQLAGTVDLKVDPVHAVSGILARYTPRTSPSTQHVGLGLEFVEVLSQFGMESQGTAIGGSAYTDDVRISLQGVLEVPADATYDFRLNGKARGRIFVNGNAWAEPLLLTAGTHRVRVIMLVKDVSKLPAELQMSIDGGAFSSIDPDLLTHNQTKLRPSLNPFDGSGSEFGGEVATLEGIGFFPADAVSVLWGNQILTPPAIAVTPERITVTTPVGTGEVKIRVKTPNGLSNPRSFTYQAGQAPVVFSTQLLASIQDPTQAVWGPDGRLYVGTVSGVIEIYTFDDDYGVTSVQTVNTIAGLTNPSVLGLAFNPMDPVDPPRVYVAHSQLFANGGDCFTGFSPYSGQVSMLEGPNFDVVHPQVTGLPVSNHDHGINGMEFDDYGDLYVLVGGNTNAGIPACPMGDLPESPYSGSLIRAQLSDPLFNGIIEYVDPNTAVLNNDQVFGDVVEVVDGVDIDFYATGLRNSLDLVYTTRGEFFATDNGPNSGFGPASTSASTQTSSAPQAADELLRLTEDHYYGHPNRNRGREDDRQNVYRAPGDAPILGQYTSPLTTQNSSINGITEYRATTFGGALRGQLLFQKWNASSFYATLAPDRRSITQALVISGGPTGLDIVHGPGGALIGVDYSGNKITLSRPQDPTALGMEALDVFPWRGLGDGATQFEIGGINFGTLADTTVTVDGVAAVLTSVSATRIRGLIPMRTDPTAAMVDIVVQNTTSNEQSVLDQAFRYLLDPATGQGRWRTETSAPIAVGEVAGGIIRGVLYLVGEGNHVTLAYDLCSGQWHSNLTVRPFAGNHHAAEVIDNKLYLFGGLGNSSAGQVQIYDPALDQWSVGQAMPFATGSASTALIDGKVYAAGGIVSNSTVTDAAVYDPVLDTWTPMAPMPVGRNHAAAGTDGFLFYVFGGRGPGSGDGNSVAEGFDDVMIYDPATDTWESSFDLESTIPPLPQKRGGTGRAAFFRGEFYVMGGETTSSGQGAVAGNVYDRVDVFDPGTRTWRTEASMLTPRHGIFPMVADQRIWVAAGGIVAGHSDSAVLEVFSR